MEEKTIVNNKIMRKLKRIVKVFLMMALACHVQLSWAQSESSKVDTLMVPQYKIGDHYYKKGISLDMSAIKSFGSLNLGDGVRIMKLEMNDGFQYPEDWKQYEISKEKIKNLDTLAVESEKTFQNMLMVRKSTIPEGAPRDSVLSDFTLKDLDGKTWNKASFLGHVVVVNMWYSGCGPCLREMPELSAWKAEYPEVLFFSANFEKADKVRRITTQRGFNWTHLVEDNYFIRWVGTHGYPVTIVIDKEGKVRKIVDGPKHWLILETIGEVLKEK